MSTFSRGVGLGFLLTLLGGGGAAAAGTGIGPLPLSLKGAPIPEVPGLLDGADPIVVDKQAAIVLGKALFWDVNVGSDGVACASCHFHAGADSRQTNQVAPTGNSGDLAHSAFDTAASGLPLGPNHRLARGDFPFVEATNPLLQTAIYGFSRTGDDVAGSAGTFGGVFSGVELVDAAPDDCARGLDAVFHQGAVGVREVTRRNAPTVINAVFNHRNFWDGRANNVFNGSSGWGERDPQAGVWVKNADGGVTKARLHLVNSSLASQALGPPTNTVEMSCTGRALADLGRKLQLRRPLEHQDIDPTDSVLGPLSLSKSGTRRPALNTFYFKLVRQAFNAKYWAATQRGPFGAPAPMAPGDRPLPYSQFEANFGVFFGLALQLYESTLISDDSPLDRSRRDAAGVPIDLSPSELRGLDEFRTSHCNVCHVGPAFTAAAVVTNARTALEHPEGFGDAAFMVSATLNVLDRARGLKGNGFVDTGFAATGVARTVWDVGLGGADAFGGPLSFAAQYLKLLAGDTVAVRDPGVDQVRACDLTLPIARNLTTANAFMFTRVDGIIAQPQSAADCFNPAGAWLPTQVAAARELANPATRKMLAIVDGAFKIPSLRNVELTGPYMHNGSMATLDQVVEFYGRGGNFDEPSKQFGLVFPQPDLQLDAGARADLIAFLKTLTDDRVRYERAPFDHPALLLTDGHPGADGPIAGGIPLAPALAPDATVLVPAVGASGRAVPLAPFDSDLAP